MQQVAVEVLVLPLMVLVGLIDLRKLLDKHFLDLTLALGLVNALLECFQVPVHCLSVNLC